MTVTIMGMEIRPREIAGQSLAGAIGHVFTLVLQGAGAAAFSIGGGFNEALPASRNPTKVPQCSLDG